MPYRDLSQTCSLLSLLLSFTDKHILRLKTLCHPRLPNPKVFLATSPAAFSVIISSISFCPFLWINTWEWQSSVLVYAIRILHAVSVFSLYFSNWLASSLKKKMMLPYSIQTILEFLLFVLVPKLEKWSNWNRDLRLGPVPVFMACTYTRVIV